MGKLILGIAAVICLDIAFVAYISTTEGPGTDVAVKKANSVGSPTETNPVERVVEQARANEAAVNDPPRPAERANPVRIASPERQQFRPLAAKRTQRNNSKPRISSFRSDQLLAARVILAPSRGSDGSPSAIQIVNEPGRTLILYRAPKESVREAPVSAAIKKTSYPAIRKAAHSNIEKPSLMARIIRKPWGWIKAIGARLR